MAVTREQFEQGLTYDAYKAQMTRNRDRLEQNERNLELAPEDLAAFSELPHPLNVLVIAEDWCGDVVANLPILGRLAKESGTLNVRVLQRDTEPGATVMREYLKDGKYQSIPVFVFLDGQFNERGYFQERPESVTRMRAERRSELYADHPEFGDVSGSPSELPDDVRVRLQTEMARMNEALAPIAAREVVRELRALITSGTTTRV